MKVKYSITMDMERLNFQRLSVTACALLTRELMKPAENKGIIILGGSEDNNVIDMEQGDDMDENYHRDFIIDQFFHDTVDVEIGYLRCQKNVR